LAFFAGGQGPSNSYTSNIDVLDLNPTTPVFIDSKKMTVARAFLASAGFQDTMLFAGGKFETGKIVNALGQVDYFYSGVIIDTQQNLSVPRFDLAGAGLSLIFDGTTYHYAIFVGGTDQNNLVSPVIDVWMVSGDQDPQIATALLRERRTAPTAAVIKSVTPIVVIAGGDNDNTQKGCQPAVSAGVQM
jgi:hypothetical protein